MALEKFSVKKGIEYVNIDDSLYFVSNIVPTGTIALYPGSSVPSGWVECNAQELLIGSTGSQYNDLYVAITNNGSSFPYGANTNGSGSAGSTHFRVPDLRGRVAVGAGAGSGLTTRTLGAWGGSESITTTNAIIAHTHTFSHTHNQPHSHSQTDPGLNGVSPHSHGISHTHSIDSHTHPVGTGSNGHQHQMWFNNTGGSGTFARRNQTTPGSLNAVHANPSGTHGHTLNINDQQISGHDTVTGDSNSLATGSSGTVSTSGPSQSNTQPGTNGSVTSISVVQKTYVLKYIIKV